MSPRPKRKKRKNINNIMSNGTNNNILQLNSMNKGIITAKPRTKFKKFPRIDDIGTISFGKALCFNMELLLIKEFVASDKLWEKKIQGNIAERTNKV